jgi:NAD(P)-dependent dehydrogenase (short-subunit alcohol dehydrogenase family)
MRFEGKAGLVTGAGSGIGRATAIGFAQRGGMIAVADLNGANANKVVEEITATGGKAIAIVADVTREADIDMMITRTTREFGRLDFLHNNAFGMPRTSASANGVAPASEVSDHVWNATLEVGLTAVFKAIRRVLPVMRAQGGGAIVNTASISGLRADYGIVA